MSISASYDYRLILAGIVLAAFASKSLAFQLQNPNVANKYSPSSTMNTKLLVINTSGKGFAPSTTTTTTPIAIDENKDDNDDDDDAMMNELIMKMKPTQIKEKLLDLLPRMTGTAEEFRYVETYVNALEDKFIAPQTLDFLNLAMVGEWQFLFTTNQLGRPSPRLRLTELVQSIEVDGLEGKLTNRVS